MALGPHAGQDTFEWDTWHGRDACMHARQAVRMRGKSLAATVLVLAGALLGTAWAGPAPAVASAAGFAPAGAPGNRGWTIAMDDGGDNADNAENAENAENADE